MRTMTVPSATMRRLRRELEISRNRNKAPLAPTGGVVAKKPSPQPPSKSKPASPAAKSKCIRKGAQVRVRTRVGTVCTGQHLVLWLRAVVECAADEDADGCLRVAYDYTNGKFPRVARVSPNDVKLHVVDVPLADASATAASTTGSSAATSDHSARTLPSSSQHDKAGPPPRPTVAGKKLPLLKKLQKEMLMNSSKAIIGCL